MFLRLTAVASVRFWAAAIFMETARPPASSLEFTMRRPLESRERLFWRASFDLPRLSPALLAAWLTLIDIIMIYLVVTQSMGRFTAFTNEASFVPSLFSKKTLKNDPKGPSVHPPICIETGQFFPHLAFKKTFRSEVASVLVLVHGMLSVVRMVTGKFRCVMSRSRSLKEKKII